MECLKPLSTRRFTEVHAPKTSCVPVPTPRYDPPSPLRPPPWRTSSRSEFGVFRQILDLSPFSIASHQSGVPEGDDAALAPGGAKRNLGTSANIHTKAPEGGRRNLSTGATSVCVSVTPCGGLDGWCGFRVPGFRPSSPACGGRWRPAPGATAAPPAPRAPGVIQDRMVAECIGILIGQRRNPLGPKQANAGNVFA